MVPETINQPLSTSIHISLDELFMFLVVKRIRDQVSYINDGCYLGPWL